MNNLLFCEDNKIYVYKKEVAEMSENQNYKPGQIADQNLTLGVISNSGQEIGTINVKEGETIPPYRSEEGVSEYRKK